MLALFGFGLFLFFCLLLHLLFDFLNVFCFNSIAAVFSDFLLLDSIFHHTSDLLFHQFLENGVRLARNCHDGFVHFFDPISLAFIANLQINCQVLLQHLLKLLSDVIIIKGQRFILVLNHLLPLSQFCYLAGILLVFFHQIGNSSSYFCILLL